MSALAQYIVVAIALLGLISICGHLGRIAHALERQATATEKLHHDSVTNIYAPPQ